MQNIAFTTTYEMSRGFICGEFAWKNPSHMGLSAVYTPLCRQYVMTS